MGKNVPQTRQEGETSSKRSIRRVLGNGLGYAASDALSKMGSGTYRRSAAGQRQRCRSRAERRADGVGTAAMASGRV